MKKKMKQFTALILTLVMCICMLPTTALASGKPGRESSGSLGSDSAVRPDDISIEDMATEYPADNGVAVMSLVESNGSNNVLLIQSTNPWNTTSNVDILESMKSDGYVDRYTVVSMNDATTVDFTDYSVVMLANDQSADSYEAYERIRVALENYVYNGGVVLFGACDNGWAGGNLENTLPGGVTKYKIYSNNNYIADSDSPVVTGELTGGTALTDGMLYSTYCSHTCFNEDSLPKGSNVILRSSDNDGPTLAEYPYGNGFVIASGQTWEYGYSSSNQGEYSKNSYDDLIVYALSLSGAEYHEKVYEPPIYEFNYEEDSPSRDLAETCSLYALLAYQETDRDSNYCWVSAEKSKTTKKMLGTVLTTDGYEDLYSYNYQEVGKKTGDVLSKKYDQTEHSICYTIGHRRIKTPDGYVRDQVVVVFRGTNKGEWYGNFDVTGSSYDSDIDYHWSFQQAVNDAMESIAEYIGEISGEGRLDTSSLSILVTGHSRGAAVSNMLAHELTDIRDGNTSGYSSSMHVGDFSDYQIKSVYAYTFATPNVAAYSKISGCSQYDNIFNFCFKDDFVPNLPMEGWSWGKYGKTYWATAASINKDSTFKEAVKTYFGKKAKYSTTYTENIASAIVKATTKKKKCSVENYYNIERWYNGPFDKRTLYEFVREGLGGTMQNKSEGLMMLIHASGIESDIVTGGFGSFLIDSYFNSLARNLIIGGALNPALNYAHQCGSYYEAMCYKFSSFKYCELTDEGYAATPYALRQTEMMSDDTAEMAESGAEESGAAEYNAEEVSALQEFLETRIVIEDYNVDITNAELLGWTSDDPSTWEGVAWENGSIIKLDLGYTGVAGDLDAGSFKELLYLDVSYDHLSGLNVSGCTKLQNLYCDGNQLTDLDITGLDNLIELKCSFNKLTELNLAGCTDLEVLSCDNNELTGLDLESCGSLNSITCEYNYLDLSDEKLLEKIEAVGSGEDAAAEYSSQKIPEQAVFDQNDRKCLQEIAEYGNNKELLGWDLDDPASWSGAEWIADQGTYYLKGVDFSGLNLTGAADFSNCTHLIYLLLSGNQFTDLCLDQCNGLETLWCAGNNLDPAVLEEIAGRYEELSAVLTPQLGNSDWNLSERDVDALNVLAESSGLEWDADDYASNQALTWKKDETGTYILTGIDLTGNEVSGHVDLSGFSSLTSVLASGTKLEKITLPDSMTAITPSAFEGCTELTGIVMPAHLEKIESLAFFGCTSLRTLVMPESLKSIGDSAFKGCTRLYLISFKGKAPELGKDAFENCRDNLTLNLGFQTDSLEMDMDETYQLSVEHFPAEDVITWETSKASVATVSDEGMIHTAAAGTALITACSNSGFSAACTVIVSSHMHEFTYTDNGDGTHTKVCATCGKNVTEKHVFTEGVCLLCGALHVHAYGEPVFQWISDDQCTAVFTCTEEDDTQTVNCTVTAKTTEATCTKEGSIVYTASVVFHGETYTDTRTVIIPKKKLDTPVLTSVTNGASGVTVKWKAVAGASRYRVFRKTSGGSWKKAGDTASTSFTDSSVKSGTVYTYTVRCITSDGKTYTSSYNTTGKTIRYLSQPSVSVSNASSGVTLKWQKVTGASGYYIYRKTGTGGYTVIGTVSGAGTVSFTDKTAKSGTVYTYTVRAYNSSSKSSYAGKNIKRLSQPSVSGVSNTASGVNVKWGKVTGASGYYVYRKTAAGSWSRIKTITGGSTVSYTDTAVKSKNGSTYLYTVRAYSGSYTSSYMSGKKVVRLTAPSVSKLTNSSSNKITVKWSKNSKATGYQIKYVTGSTAKTVTVKGASTVSKVISGLARGKTYKVYIRSYKTSSGTNYYSAWSSAKSVKITK